MRSGNLENQNVENAPRCNGEQSSIDAIFNYSQAPQVNPFVAGLSCTMETQYDVEYIFFELDGITRCIPIHKRRLPYAQVACTFTEFAIPQFSFASGGIPLGNEIDDSYNNHHIVKTQLNGSNGEATNSDDVVPNTQTDNADRKRRHKEARNHRNQRDPGTKNEAPTLHQLLRNWQDARKSYSRALQDGERVDSVISKNHMDNIKNEILKEYPNVTPDVTNMLNDEYVLPIPHVEPVRNQMVQHRIYITTVSHETNSESYFCYATLTFVFTCLAVLFFVDIFPNFFGEYTNVCVGAGCTILALWSGYLQDEQRGEEGVGGSTPDFIGNSNRNVANDDTFSEMEIVDSTFWKCKGYTHYVDIEFPTFYDDITVNQVHNVVAGCSTDSQLVPIAFATLMRDKTILEEYSRGRYQESVIFYNRYYAMYVAQQHMYHLYQSTLMAGRLGKITLPGWDGSTLNFRYGGRIHGLIKLGIVRQYFEQTQLKEAWLDNGRFTVKKCVYQGKTYYFPRNTTPSEWLARTGFTEVDHINQKRLQRYRTKLLTFHNGGVLLGRTNANLISALNRMFTCRESEKYERLLQQNQYKNVRLGTRRLGKILSKVCETVRSQFDTRCEIDELIGQMRVISETHPKKKLREEAHEYIKQMTLLKEATYTKKVTAKVKIEVAKFMKNARVYVDMTTPQSLLGSWLVEPMKNAMKEIDLGWCLFIFVKTTDEQTVHAAFEKLRDQVYRPVCVFHSDDAVLMLPCKDGVLRLNLDISSCDRSNLTPIFDLLLQMVPDGPWKFIYERMVQGCTLPLIIPNPSGNGEYVRVVPTVPFEYSGCNLTTLLNNVALLVIASSIFWKFNSNMTKQETEKLITSRAESVGYKVTVSICERVEQVQFLKYSPSDSINWFPVRNLGCVLRAVGHYDGDLPGRGSLEKRALDHVSQVVTGITTGYIDPISQVLRERFCSLNPLSNRYQWQVQKYSHPVSVTHLINRYNLSEYQIHMLRELVKTCSIGDYVTSPILDVIFRVDY